MTKAEKLQKSMNDRRHADVQKVIDPLHTAIYESPMTWTLPVTRAVTEFVSDSSEANMAKLTVAMVDCYTERKRMNTRRIWSN